MEQTVQPVDGLFKPLGDISETAVLQFCRVAQELLDATRVVIWLHDASAHTVSISPYVVERPGTTPRIPSRRWTQIPLSEFPLACEVFEQRRSVVLKDAPNDARLLPGMAVDLGLTSCQIEPLTTPDNQVIGAIAFEPAFGEYPPELQGVIPLITMSLGQAIVSREAQQRRLEAEFLFGLSHAATENRPLDETLHSVSVELLSQLRLQKAAVFGIEEGTLTCWVCVGQNADTTNTNGAGSANGSASEQPLTPPSVLARDAARSGQLSPENQHSSSGRIAMSEKPMSGEAPRKTAAIAVPLGSHPELLGVLELTKLDGRYFSEADIRLASAAATHIAWVIERDRAAQERGANLRVAAAIRRLLQEGARAVSVEQAGEVLARITRDVLEAQHAVVLLRDDDGNIGHLATVGVHPSYINPLRQHLVGKPFEEFPLWRRTSDHLDTAFVEDGRESALLPTELVKTFSLGSYVSLPILSGRGVLGLVICANLLPRQWSEAQRHLVTQVMLEGSLVVENARLRAAERERMTELAHQAFHDSLTNLPNRTLFMDRLQHALQRAQRHNGAVGVLFLDLDGFKEVNDGLGHELGDDLLVKAARRLEECLRPEDTIARLGGDEFTILLEDIVDVTDALHVAERIGERFEPAFDLGNHEIFVTSSIGIAINDPSPDMEPVLAHELVRNADLAMYRAKRQGKARHELFNTERDAPAIGHLEIETALRKSIEHGELRLHYQPMVSMTTGEATAMEALIRWQHPERGLLIPREFMPIAEKTGLIVTIGSWVLQETCRELKEWEQTHGTPTPTLWVNLSARQFQRTDLVTEVAGLLDQYDLPPGSLGLELTESVLIEDAELATEMLEAMKSLGVQLSIDDFGTGYSSLSYLKRFPVDTLKIDRSFIADLHDRDNAAIVRAVIMLAHTLGQNVIAEGVETTEQFIELRELGCELAQGFWFSEAVPADRASKLLGADPPWAHRAVPV